MLSVIHALQRHRQSLLSYPDGPTATTPRRCKDGKKRSIGQNRMVAPTLCPVFLIRISISLRTLPAIRSDRWAVQCIALGILIQKTDLRPKFWKKNMEILIAQWSEIAGEELSKIIFPVAFTGNKARRLLIKADAASKPPWGGWDHLSTLRLSGGLLPGFVHR